MAGQRILSLAPTRVFLSDKQHDGGQVSFGGFYHPGTAIKGLISFRWLVSNWWEGERKGERGIYKPL